MKNEKYFDYNKQRPNNKNKNKSPNKNNISDPIQLNKCKNTFQLKDKSYTSAITRENNRSKTSLFLEDQVKENGKTDEGLPCFHNDNELNFSTSIIQHEEDNINIPVSLLETETLDPDKVINYKE